jgi:hypothetical protein
VWRTNTVRLLLDRETRGQQDSEGANMSKHFITGAARSVTNPVERLIELRKKHPEWDEALARERLVPPKSTPFTEASRPLAKP